MALYAGGGVAQREPFQEAHKWIVTGSMERTASKKRILAMKISNCELMRTRV
jgi:hypothetical protein